MELNNNSREREVRIDIESGEASNGSHSNWGKISLNSILGRILGYDGSNESSPRANSEYESETTKLLVDKNTGSPQSPAENESENENEIERRRGGKVKKAPKPPRPPKGPSLDAADMRLLKELSRIAIKKRERLERVKAFKKMKAARALSASTSSSSSPSLSPSAATISAMFVTVFFLLMLFFQGITSTTSSHFIPAVAPQPAPMTTGLTPVEFYKAVMSDDGTVPKFLPPRSARAKLAGM